MQNNASSVWRKHGGHSMKVVVIGCDPSEIISACQLTLSRLAKEGHKVYAILAPLKASELLSSCSSSEIVKDEKLATIGITRTFIIETFDYSAITQTNADAVNSYIKDIQPSVVIMPSWKSPNHMRRILARASLIACRGIGTILMYELDAKNTSFNPVITFEVSREPTSVQHTNNIVETTITTTGQDIMDIRKTFTNISTLEKKGSKTVGHEVQEEKFESHRTLLLEEDGLF
jgi:hypothetical protein